MKTAAYFIEKLNLSRHPEGGWYREVYRSDALISCNDNPAGINNERAFCTSIYYLLEGNDFSAFHRIKSDEIWHYYAGTSAVEILIPDKDQLRNTSVLLNQTKRSKGVKKDLHRTFSIGFRLNLKISMMKKIRKEEIRQEVFDLYDDYAHNRIDRRQFMEKLSLYTAGGLTVSSLMSFMMPNYQDNIQVKAGDPGLESEYVEYNSPQGGGKIKGLLSRPVDNKNKLPGIVVVHENRGLNPHIEDVSRRAALEGFLVLAPDALTPLGGYPGNDDDGRAMQSKRDRDEMLEDFIAAYDFLKEHPECNGSIGVVGFCFGGWIANMMAVRIPDLKAAVPFYGGQPNPEEVPSINAALLLHFAENDARVNAGWPEYEEALKKNNVDFDAYMYPNVNHGFHNDTTPRFDEGAAKLAWQRTIDFLKEKLS